MTDDTEYERVVDFDRGLRRFQKVSILVGIFIILAAGIVIAFLWNAETATIKFELAKLVAQAILIGLGGALLSLVVSEYQLRQAQVEAQRMQVERRIGLRKEVVASVLDRTLNAYNGVKRARRLLRAQALRAVGGRREVLSQPYDDQMLAINNLQLEFERLVTESELDASVFTDSNMIGELYKDLESRLSKLITEYETLRPEFDKGGTLPLDRFKELRKFIEQGQLKGIKEPYREVQALLRKDLIRAGTIA
jgi:hypothetical protein